MLDFQSIKPFEFLRVRGFLDLFLKQLLNRSNGTKVAIVTKKSQPIAAWYLKSGRPGFTILTALQVMLLSLLYYFCRHSTFSISVPSL